MRTSRLIPLALAVALYLAAPVQAGTVYFFSQPTTDYTANTHLMPVSGSAYDSTTSLTDGTMTVGFSNAVEYRYTPISWFTWGNSPDTEGSSASVLYNSGNSLVLTFPVALSVFGFEAEPVNMGSYNITASFSGPAGTNNRSLDVEGANGALLFAALGDASTTFTSVTISTTDSGFGIARLRYRLATESQLEFPSGDPGGDPPSATPEPASLAMMAGGIAALAWMKLRRGRQASRSH